MTTRRRLAAAGLGCALFVVACALPRVGLFRGHLGTSLFQSYGDRTLAGEVPYRDFSLEYPPGALPAFVVPSLGPAGDYDTWFMAFEALCGCSSAALVGLVARMRAAAYCALAPLALGPLVLHRYDLWATFLAVSGFAGLLAGRQRSAFAALGAGTAAKVFPVVLVPLALLHVGRRAARRCVVWFVGTASLIVAPFLVLGPGGIRFSVERQLGRALQLETVYSSALLALHSAGAYAPRVRFGHGSWNLSGGLPDTLVVLSTALQLGAVCGVWILYARGPRTRNRLVLAAAAAVAAWIAFGRVLSPQFLLWLVPLVALAFAWRHALLLLAVLALTQAVYPSRYDELVDLRTTPILLLVARNVVLLALLASLVLDLQRQRVLEEVGGNGERGDAGEPVLLDRGERDRPDGVPRLQPRRRE